MAKSIENSIDFAAKRQVWQRMILLLPNKLLHYWGANLPCFAVAPLRGERNGNQIVIDVPVLAAVGIQA